MESILPSTPSITVHLWVGLALHSGNLTEEAGSHRVSTGHGVPDTPEAFSQSTGADSQKPS